MAELGIVAALAREASGLAGRIPAGVGLKNLSDDVVLAVSGMGALRARTAGQSLIAQGATALMSWGSAGALDAGLAPGTLLLPERVVSARGRDILVDAGWHSRLRRVLEHQMTVCTAPLAESTAVLSGPDAKRALGERTDAVAADMESAALGALARETDVAFLVVRAVADGAVMTIPESVLAALDRDGSVRPIRLLGRLAAAPGDWVALARLALGFGKARATLAQVARQAGPTFLAPHRADKV